MSEITVSFGIGKLELEKIDLSKSSKLDQAKYFGLQLGCPKVPSIIIKEGEEKMAPRYFQIIFYFGYLKDALEQFQRYDLLSSLDTFTKRLPNEPLASYDIGAIPEWNKQWVPPTEAPVGYAIPRLILMYEGEERINALDMLDKTIKELKLEDDAKDLLISFAENIIRDGRVKPEVVLKNTISHGMMLQNSFYESFDRIITKIEKKAPELWRTYSNMSPVERVSNGIANLSET